MGVVGVVGMASNLLSIASKVVPHARPTAAGDSLVTGRLEFGRGMKQGAASWLRWIEPWYLAYALLGVSVAGLLPIVLPLVVHDAGGAAQVGLALLQGMGAAGAATVANLFVVETHPLEEWEERIG